jgi:RNA polymerase sigma factor (sigma-70 family)
LRAVVAQLAVDQHRKQSRLVQTEDDGDFDRLMQHGQDEANWSAHSEAANPEQEISRKLTSAQMQKALADSVSALAAEDRLLVKLYYFDGLRLREAGAVLGVHEATASRRLARVHAELRQQVQTKLIDLGWTVSETERAFAEVAPTLETDIQPLLNNDRLAVKKENEVAG